MFRRLLAALLAVLALSSTGYAFGARQMAALTLNIGAPAIALVQSGPITSSSGINATATLATPSVTGNTLIAVLANANSVFGPLINPYNGWYLLMFQTQGATDLEVWAYFGNPGGISAVTFAGTGVASPWYMQISEWSSVSFAQLAPPFNGTDYLAIREASGNLTATSGTTLAPTTTGNVLSTGDLALSVWTQVAALGTPTFTTPGGFTRLKDNGATSLTQHLDAEYKVNPATGATLGPTLTSTATTTSAVGIIVCLKAAPPQVDQTAFIRYGTMSIKQNTADFALIDPATVPSLGDPVAITGNQTWNGRVVSVTVADVVDIKSGHKLVTIAATNQTTAPVTTPPGNLSDTVSGGYLLQENGFKILLEDNTGALLLEGTLFTYQGLSVKSTQNIDGTTSTYGTVTVFETGFQAGQTIQITSSNLGLSAASYLITNVSQTFMGAASTQGAYLIEFGDPYLSLQLAGAGVLTKQGQQASIQQGVQMPAGVLGYAQVTANQTLITAQVDLTGLTVTVTVAAGRRVRVIGVVGSFSSSVGTDGAALYIMEGATQLMQTNSAGGANNPGIVAETVLTPSAGVHTYKLQALRIGTGNLTMAAAATFPASITVQDIGT